MQDAIHLQEGNVNPKLMTACYWMVGATIVGARLGHVFFYDWGYYKNHWRDPHGLERRHLPLTVLLFLLS